MKYAIVTPAYNEERFIEKTIASIIAQEVRPVKWVIVNDGSSDRTREIVEKYLPQYSFIELINVERAAVHSFGAKSRAFNRGVERLKPLDVDFIGNLDADMSLEPPYYANILKLFAADPKLGVCGGIIYTTVGDKFVTADETLDSVAGAVQLFRRACFADIGEGLLPFAYGGEDAAAEFTARMKGWTVRKSLENKAYEHRQTGTATGGALRAAFRLGPRFHSLGYSLSFFGLRCVYRIGDPPAVIGSLATFFGFVDSILRRRPVILTREVVEFVRREQRKRVRRTLFPWTAKAAK